MRALCAMALLASAIIYPVSGHVAPGREFCVALTFDDGPHKDHTPKILDALEREGARATFYVVGKWVELRQDIVRRAFGAGHEIGNHTWDHEKWLSKVPTGEARWKIAKTDEIIKKVTGEYPRTLRAPFKAYPADLSVGGGRPFIDWDIDTRDAFGRSSNGIIQAALSSKNGSIVLMHDIQKATVAAVPTIIRELKKRGARFVTVSEFLNGACGFVAKPPLIRGAEQSVAKAH